MGLECRKGRTASNATLRRLVDPPKRHPHSHEAKPQAPGVLSLVLPPKQLRPGRVRFRAFEGPFPSMQIRYVTARAYPQIAQAGPTRSQDTVGSSETLSSLHWATWPGDRVVSATKSRLL